MIFDEEENCIPMEVPSRAFYTDPVLDRFYVLDGLDRELYDLADQSKPGLVFNRYYSRMDNYPINRRMP